MKKRFVVIFLLIIFMFGSIEVNASSGRLRKDSIKTCNGITYGQHSSDNHWHVAEEKDGSYYATGNSIYSDPCSSSNNPSSSGSSSNSDSSSSSSSSNNNYSNSIYNNKQDNVVIKQEPIKSGDNTLKTIIIDNEELLINDTIEYSTTNEKVNIEVKVNDDKAKYEILNDSTLVIGDNKVLINVTAENGDIKTYTINIIRNKILSADTGIKVFIDDDEVVFIDNKASISVDSSTKSIDLNYILNDKNAKAFVDKIDKLKTGDNILNIKVVAENGTEQNYEINIYKYSMFDDVISIGIGLWFIGGIACIIYCIIKSVKSKRR